MSPDERQKYVVHYEDNSQMRIVASPVFMPHFPLFKITVNNCDRRLVLSCLHRSSIPQLQAHEMCAKITFFQQKIRIIVTIIIIIIIIIAAIRSSSSTFPLGGS